MKTVFFIFTALLAIRTDAIGTTCVKDTKEGPTFDLTSMLRRLFASFSVLPDTSPASCGWPAGSTWKFTSPTFFYEFQLCYNIEPTASPKCVDSLPSVCLEGLSNEILRHQYSLVSRVFLLLHIVWTSKN